MNTIEELKGCLALQEQIDELTLQLRRRYKAVIEAQRAKGNDRPIYVELDGQMYALEREDQAAETQRMIMQGHELGGFYFYRLHKKGNLLR